MTRDILADVGYLALSSRLKRIAERLQAQAAKAHADLGYPIQPSQFPLLAALDRYGPLSVSEAVEALGISQPGVTRTHGALMDMGLTEAATSDGDGRLKQIRLSAKGRALIDEMKRSFWVDVEEAARTMCSGPDTDLLSHIARLEKAVEARALDVRVEDIRRSRAQDVNLLLVEYTDELAGEFEEITREWVESMFRLEEEDLRILKNPREMILERGGTILFVSTPDLGVVGTCALMPVEGATFELTKMGVKSSARGRQAGAFLLDRILERARALPIKELFLLTNRKCEAAIHLYEKAGFVHDKEIMVRFGGRYGRCDVAMSYDLEGPMVAAAAPEELQSTAAT